MSTTVDSRVVEMRFDNKHFEQNVSTTMSTLDKLKQKLHLDGATKGLENVNTAAKGVKMDGLGAAVESVSAKFSALQVMGVTALANITNSAVNAGKRMIKALTLDPVTTGFKEYETQINATQTILANTKSKGSTIDDVNKALEELNRYADMTIYNFTEMTKNIGTFTAAGIDLETSVNAIQGIANLAAVSGSTSQQASTAMYQLSQALASGTVKLMDWNSVVNAGMGGEVFQNALKQTSRELETGADAAIEASGSFRESLKDGWLTAEVLTETLKKFTTTGANEYVAEFTGLTVEAIEAEVERAKATGDSKTAMDRAAESIAKMSGASKDAIKEALEFAETATDAATKVKTFTQLWDVLKEAAQSGWSKTWKLIIGDFEQAKSLLTPLADILTGFINKMSDWRNAILESALGRGFTNLLDSIKTVMTPASEAISTVTSSLKSLDEISDEVIAGKWNNWTERFDALRDAGYNYCLVQNEVNRKLNNGFRYTEEQIAAQDKLIGAQTTLNETQKEAAKTQVELTEADAKRIAELARMTDAELKALGYTEKQIAAFRELAKAAEKVGLPLEEFLTKINEINGRWLLINSFKNIGKGLVDVFNTLKGAWQEIFPPKTIEEIATHLFNAITAFHKFTTRLRLVNDETGKLTEAGENLKRTFKGIFAVLDVVTTILGSGFKIALKVASGILKYFNLDILEVTALIGDALVKFRDWFDSIFDISWILDSIVPAIDRAVTAVKEWFKAFKTSEGMQNAIEYIKEIGASIRDWWASLGDTEDLPKTIAEGIVNFFSNIPTIISTVFSQIRDAIASSFSGFDGSMFGGFIDSIRSGLSVAGQVIIELGKILLEKLNSFLSAHGFEEISQDSIAGLVNGFKNGASEAWNAAVAMAKSIVQKVKDFLGIHSPSRVFAAIGGFIVAGLVMGLRNGIPDSLGAVKDLFQPMLDWISGIDLGAVVAALVGVGTVKVAGTAAGALANFSEAFAGVGDILANTAIFVKKMTGPIKQVVKGFAKIEKAVAFKMRMDGVKTLVTSLLLLVGAIVVLTFIPVDKLWDAVLIVGALAVILVALSFAMSKLSNTTASFNFKEGLNMQGLSTGLIGIGAAILLIAAAVKLMGSMNAEEVKQGFLSLAGVVGAIALVLVTFSILNKGSGEAAKNIGKLGGTLVKLSIALLLMAAVVKIASGLEEDELKKGAIFAGGFLAFLLAVNLIALIPSKGIDKIGGMMLKLSLAMLLMIAVVKLAAGLNEAELIAGAKFAGGFLAFVGILALVGALGGKAMAGLGKMVLSLSISMLLLVGVMKLVAMLSPEEMAKGLIAITMFALIIGVFVYQLTKPCAGQAPKVAATILAFAVAIGILAAVAIVCGLISIEGLAKGIVAVGLLSAMMALMIAATRGANNVTGNIVAITVAIGLMVAAVALLTFIDPTKLAIATGAMILLMGVFALVIKLSGTAQKAMGVILAMSVAVGLIGGVLYLLGGLPVKSVMGSALALSGLMVVMTAVLYLLVPIGSLASMALMGVLALTAMAIPLLAMVGVLALMKNINNAMTNVKALSLFAVTMSAVLLVLSLLGPAALMAIPAMGALAAVIGILGAIVLAAGLLSKIPGFNEVIADGGETLALIGSALGRFVGSIVSGFASEVLSILPMFGEALSGFMVGVTPFIDGLKNIDEDVLIGIGILSAAILALTAAELIAGLASLGGLGLMALGAELSGFMLAAMPFIMTAATITPEMMTGVKALAETILILTAADILQGLASFITGGSSLETFASQLPTLGQGLSAFATSLGSFTEDQLTTVNCAAQAVKTLAQASSEIPNAGGLLGQLVGENDLGTFAAQFPTLGTGLRSFLDNVGTFSEDQVATVDCAAQAIKALAQASSEIPNAGGLLGQLVGENDLGTFAAQFPILGTGLRGFLDNVGEFTDDQVATVNCAAQAVKTLAQASSEIPNAGGWLAQIVGDNELGTFAEQFPALGTGLRGFLDNVGTLDETANGTIVAGANAVKSLATAAANIPNEGGWISKIVGDNNLATFAENFPTLGTALRGFIDNIGTFTDAQVSTVSATVSAINALSKLANSDLSGATKHLSDFGNDLPDFASDIGDFCSNMPSVDSMSTAVSNINTLLSAIKSIGNADSGCLATFADNLKKVGKNAVDKFVEAFTSSSAKTNLKDAAKKLGDQVVDGIGDKEKAIKTAGENAAKKAVSGVETQENDMESAGKDLGSGLVRGIKSKETAVYNAGYNLGRKAVQGEKDGQNSASPSKETIKAGKWLGEGLVIGMGKMAGSVYNAGHNLGSTVTNTISSAVSKVSELVNTDIDSQPTIRPVLDLSDVRSGVGAISGMFAGANGIGVQANVSAISSMMNSRSQNGANTDVVSAIDKLRKDLGNINSNSYSINGINVSEGTDAADAIHTLVRVIKMEGRS